MTKHAETKQKAKSAKRVSSDKYRADYVMKDKGGKVLTRVEVKGEGATRARRIADKFVGDGEFVRARLATDRRGPGRAAGKRLELDLEGVRKAFAKTQVDVATASGIQQADVSRLENKESYDEVLVGTLRRYARALGGELELVVVAPNGARIVVAEEERRRP